MPAASRESLPGTQQPAMHTGMLPRKGLILCTILDKRSTAAKYTTTAHHPACTKKPPRCCRPSHQLRAIWCGGLRLRIYARRRLWRQRRWQLGGRGRRGPHLHRWQQQPAGALPCKRLHCMDDLTCRHHLALLLLLLSAAVGDTTMLLCVWYPVVFHRAEHHGGMPAGGCNHGRAHPAVASGACSCHLGYLHLPGHGLWSCVSLLPRSVGAIIPASTGLGSSVRPLMVRI